MKKTILAVAAGLAAAAGFGKNVPNSTPQMHTESASPNKEALSAPQSNIPFSIRAHEPNNYGIPSMVNDGVPPKMWGEYLQSKGRQKWTKSRRK